MIGIYKIENLIDGNLYYGSSKNIQKRWKTHRSQLNRGKHGNVYLQRAWTKYGNNSFIFEIVEECSLDLLLEREQYYLDLNPKYNIGMKSSGGDNLSKNPNREEIIKKMTRSVRERYDKMSQEERNELHSYPMEKNPNWKGGRSVSFCEICGSRISKGVTNRCRKHLEYDRIGEKNAFYGKSHSEEFKSKMSKMRTGTYSGDQNKPIIIDGIEYRSAGEASKILNIPMVTIRWRVLSKNEKFENYKYK